jgi:hypothetical protein
VKKFIVINFLIGACVFSACTLPYIKQGNQKIVFLQNTLNDAQLSLLSIDTLQLKKISEECTNTISLLKAIDNIEKNTEDKEVINRFGLIEELLQNLLGVLPELNESIIFSQSQLTDLQHDLKKRIIKKNEFAKYILEEEKEVLMLKEEIETMIKNLNSQLIIYDTLYPKITKVIELYK